MSVIDRILNLIRGKKEDNLLDADNEIAIKV